MKQTELYNFLYQFGLRGNRPGFFYTAYAIRLLAAQPELALGFRRELYQKVADLYGTNCESVEHDIQATLMTVWRRNPALVEAAAGEPLRFCPRPLAFLLMLSIAFRKTHSVLQSAVSYRRNISNRVEKPGSGWIRP